MTDPWQYDPPRFRDRLIALTPRAQKLYQWASSLDYEGLNWEPDEGIAWAEEFAALEQRVERLTAIKGAVVEYYMIKAASALQGGGNTAGLRPEDIWREYAPQMVADALAAEEESPAV